MVLFSYKKRVPFLIPKGKDGKRMKKIKMFMGAFLCMNLLALSGCGYYLFKKSKKSGDF